MEYKTIWNPCRTESKKLWYYIRTFAILTITWILGRMKSCILTYETGIENGGGWRLFGLVYLVLCFFTGRELAEAFYFKRMRPDPGNRIWIVLPASFGMGILTLTWSVYLTAWINESLSHSRHPLFLGNLLVMAGVSVLLAVLAGMRIFRKKKVAGKTVTAHLEDTALIREEHLFKKEVLFFLL